MPDPRLPDLVAHYLSSHYPSVLPAFLHASGTAPPDPTSPPVPDLQTLVSDAQTSALATKLGSTSIDELKGAAAILAQPLPAKDTLSEVDRAFEHITDGNLLAVVVGDVPHRELNTSTAEYEARRVRSVVCAGADKAVRVLDWSTGEVTLLLEPHKAPILSLALHPTNPRYLVSGAMDGNTVLTDLITRTTLQTFTSGKFVVRLAFSPEGHFLAVASYDKSVSVYEAITPAHHVRIGDEDADAWLDALDPSDDPDAAADPGLRYKLAHRITTEGNPEALLFHPRSSWLMYTQRGSHQLHYLGLPPSQSTAGGEAPWDWPERAKSFNPHSMDTHVSFAVLDLALHPSGHLIAGITGDHAGTGAERVLLYGVEPEDTERLGCLWTGSEPDAFVLPRLAFLPSGKGIVTTNANGQLTLLSLQGQVKSKLKVHAARSGVAGTSDVVRDLAIVELGEVEREGDGKGEEAEKGWEVVSVGYDRTVKLTLGRRGAT